MPDLKETFETVSPVSIETGETSIKVGISRRFLLFKFLRWLTRKIEDDPHLNFVSILKTYKAFTEVLDGTLYELHRDRNTVYFRNFFIDEELYKDIKEDLEWVEARVADPETVKLTITKRGVIVYDCYVDDKFNTLLLTAHSGTWMREDISRKQALTKQDRLLEEDIATHKLYSDLVLKKGGIWIDNKASRFACDYNRPRERAIYENHQETWLDIVWHEPLSAAQRNWLLEGHDQFYHLLSSLVRTHQFNIIFDGHSMKDAPDRAGISFGTKFIPRFYMPIVTKMQDHLKALGHKDVALNSPYYGGNIPEFMYSQFPNQFIFSVEVNKRLYMTKDRKKVKAKDCEKLARDIAKIFDI